MPGVVFLVLCVPCGSAAGAKQAWAWEGPTLGPALHGHGSGWHVACTTSDKHSLVLHLSVCRGHRPLAIELPMTTWVMRLGSRWVEGRIRGSKPLACIKRAAILSD